MTIHPWNRRRTARLATLCVATLAATAMSTTSARAQQTSAERSKYAETSRYDEVRAFLDTLARRGAPYTFGVLGRTTEGREIPYVIAARPRIATLTAARRQGRPVVYVNANIHAGEVEGKEAMLTLLRDLAFEQRKNVLDSLVLIVVPIYNADGNEAIRPQGRNRPEQNGPELVGQRANGQGFDLNRDYVKAEAPETRATLDAFRRWDPDVYVDLHTTDGSYHGYALTYSPSLAPGAPLGAYTRQLLGAVRARMRSRHGFETFDYGNFDRERDISDSLKGGWYTYDARPRFGTNYAGLRNMVSVLSEAFSHDPFERRIRSTEAFVRELLSLVAERRAELLARRRAAMRNETAPVPVRAALTPAPDTLPVLVETIRKTGDSAMTEPGVPRGYRRTGQIVAQRMPVYDRFVSALDVARPVGYVIPAADSEAVALLRVHGVPVDRLARARRLTAASFVVDSVAHARPFQKHAETRVLGRWTAPAVVEVPAGSYLVPATGPLGALAVFLLEPESADGLLDWNVFDRELAPGRPFPVLRVLRPSR